MKKKAVGVKCRHKPTKSCMMCQKRKKKCDRLTPSCTACLEKGLQCVYNIKLETRLTEGTKQLSKSQLIAQIALLKSELNEGSREIGRNPVLGLQYTSSKQGRVLTYGPTSVRCLIRSSQLQWCYTAIWKTIKEKRNDWKKNHIHAIKVEEIYSIGNPLSISGGNSILEALCDCLPTMHVLKHSLDRFFNCTLFKEFEILDPLKVASDLEECFISDQEGRIMSINIYEKKNYYRLGIITRILTIVHFKERVPTAVELFHKYLAAFESAKSMHIERAQFFMLKYLFINARGFTAGDGGNSITIINLALLTAMQTGLYRTENLGLFRDRERYIKNLCVLIVQADFESSFSLGSQLQVSEYFLQDLDGRANPEISEDGNFSTLQYFLFLRQQLAGVSSIHNAPSLPLSISKLKFSLLVTFGELKHYLSRTAYDPPIEFQKLYAILLSLQIIANFSLIQTQVSVDGTLELQQQALICHIASLILVFNYMEALYNDQMLIKGGEDHIDACIDIGLGLFLYHNVLPRATHELVLIFSDALNTSEGFGVYSTNSNDVDIKRFNEIVDNFLKSDKDIDFGANVAYKYFERIHENFKNNRSKKLDNLLHQSYLFIVCDEFSNSLVQAFKEPITLMTNKPDGISNQNIPFTVDDNDLFLDNALEIFDDEFTSFFFT